MKIVLRILYETSNETNFMLGYNVLSRIGTVSYNIYINIMKI